jgi:predicted GNAT family N-acyltransferase
MHVRTADFGVDYAAIRRIRLEVFVDEQGVPEELELDDRDAACTHVLAIDDAGAAVGTGRIDTDGKIGRVAVRAGARRTGVGLAMMELLHQVARERDLAEVWCHAQISALSFYRRLGYTALGEVFLEAGIEHVEMRRRM